MKKGVRYLLYLIVVTILLSRLNYCDGNNTSKVPAAKGKRSNAKATSHSGLQVADLSQALPNNEQSSAQDSRENVYQVKRVIDGDTIIITDANEDIRLRLIGVDTPETVHPNKPVEHFGKEASEYLKNLLTGREVRLEFDPANSAGKHRDRYGRLLAYVYRHPDGIFVNEAIIRGGYGFAYVKFPFQHLERFRALEREAREKGAGLWGE